MITGLNRCMLIQMLVLVWVICELRYISLIFVFRVKYHRRLKGNIVHISSIIVVRVLCDGFVDVSFAGRTGGVSDKMSLRKRNRRVRKVVALRCIHTPLRIVRKSLRMVHNPLRMVHNPLRIVKGSMLLEEFLIMFL